MPDDPDFEVIRRAWAATNEGDEEIVRACLHAEIVAIPLTVEGETYRGVEEVMAWWRENLPNWEAFEIVPEAFTRQGDEIVATGGWYAPRPEGKRRLVRPARWVLRMKDGLIAYWRTYSS